VSKKNKINAQKRFLELQKEYIKAENEALKKVNMAGLKFGSKTGGDGKYWTYGGVAYEIRKECLEDIIKRENL